MTETVLVRVPIHVERELPVLLECLGSRVQTLQRAATKAAGELEAGVVSGETKDPRSGAVRIQKTLAEANILQSFGLRLARAAETPEEQLPEPVAPPQEKTTVEETSTVVVDDPASNGQVGEGIPPGFRSVLQEDDLGPDPIAVSSPSL